MVVVDKLSKYAHFIHVNSTYKVVHIALFFMKYFLRLHGTPKKVIFDRDVQFTKSFWKALFVGLET
jgi:hypothetical protein